MQIAKKMLEKSGTLEVFFRKVVTSISPIKKRVKHTMRKKTGINNITADQEEITEFRKTLRNCDINEGDIVIIHSSMDGLNCLGLSPNSIIDLILEVFSKATVVFAAFPVEPKRKKRVYTYNPQKTPCGTGMLPNLFLTRTNVLRSSFPYNSLAAVGQEAENMMKNEYNSIRPHDKYSSWEYCRMRHAKLLFLGTTSREANTMAIHMVPDVMDAEWPINNWYELREYNVIIGDVIDKKNIQVQSGYWYQYVNEYKTDKILKDNNYLRDISTKHIHIEIVDDSYEMMQFLISRCKNGQLMYKIPRRLYNAK